MKSVFVFALAIATVAGGWGQAAPVATSPTAKVPEFDVVSVKENKKDDGNISFSSDDEGFRISGAPLVMLIRRAYGLYNATDEQIIGLTGWAKSERFDIVAKVAEADIPRMKDLKMEQNEEMMRNILADRFHLVAHLETREMPVFQMVIAKNGLKLKISDTSVASDVGTHVKGCKEGCMGSSNTHLDGKGIDMDNLASFLTGRVEKTVIDKTGLKGKFDCSLDWTPDNQKNPDVNGPPEILTAIQEQWGLKLEPSKGPVKILVVDHLEQPTAN
jgi:uncharacterized protein (TIGR03435 family)